MEASTTAPPAEAEKPVHGDVIDADAVPTPDQPDPAAAPESAPDAPQTALEVRTGGVASREVLMPLDTEQVIQGMQAYQEMLPRLLDRDDWQGKPGAKGSFVKKSGWRKIARAFNLSTEIVKQEIERDPEGGPLRASVIVRAIAPNGQTSDGDGYCAKGESRFSSQGGRQKLENDLRATATTRAKNRAISDLVGMGAVSAEEAATSSTADTPPWGPEADAKMIERAHRALAYLLDTGDGPDERSAEAVFNEIAKGNGYFPAATGGALVVAATKLHALLEAQKAQAAEEGVKTPDDDIPWNETADPADEPNPDA